MSPLHNLFLLQILVVVSLKSVIKFFLNHIYLLNYLAKNCI